MSDSECESERGGGGGGRHGPGAAMRQGAGERGRGERSKRPTQAAAAEPASVPCAHLHGRGGEPLPWRHRSPPPAALRDAAPISGGRAAGARRGRGALALAAGAAGAAASKPLRRATIELSVQAMLTDSIDASALVDSTVGETTIFSEGTILCGSLEMGCCRAPPCSEPKDANKAWIRDTIC